MKTVIRGIKKNVTEKGTKVNTTSLESDGRQSLPSFSAMSSFNSGADQHFEQLRIHPFPLDQYSLQI